MKLSLLIILCFSFVCCAYATQATISAEDIVTQAGKTISIPLKISDNCGIMGFKLTVEYPNEVLIKPKVLQGAALPSGMINDSISDSTNGMFDIVWSNAADINTDGVIAVLQFDVAENAKIGKYIIRLSFSQADTFNEKWEDVELVLNDIGIRIVDAAHENTTAVTTKASVVPMSQPVTAVAPTMNTTHPETLEYSENVKEAFNEIDSDSIISAMENALDTVGADNIENMNGEQLIAFEDQVNTSFKSYGIDAKLTFADKESYKQVYDSAIKDRFIRSVTASTDSSKIIGAVENTLNDYSVRKVDELSAEQQKTFADNVITKLEESGAETQELPDGFSDEQKVEVIRELFSTAEEESTQGVKTSERKLMENTTANSRVLFYSIASVMAILIISLIIYKKIKINKDTGESFYDNKT